MLKSGMAPREFLCCNFICFLLTSRRRVVKLVKNFRSHEAILQFPNLQFYGGDLQPCADTRITNAYLGSSYLPSKQFPIVFHAIKGKDLRESSSPSFFNIDEVTQVKSYVQLLREDRRFRTGMQLQEVISRIC